MERNDGPEISGAYKLAVLIAVVVAILIVIALKTVPKAERPTLRTPVTVVSTP